MAKRSRDIIKWNITPNRKPYGLIMILGGIVGISLYHVLGHQIDTVWNQVPYLKQIHSN